MTELPLWATLQRGDVIEVKSRFGPGTEPAMPLSTPKIRPESVGSLLTLPVAFPDERISAADCFRILPGLGQRLQAKLLFWNGNYGRLAGGFADGRDDDLGWSGDGAEAAFRILIGEMLQKIARWLSFGEWP